MNKLMKKSVAILMALSMVVPGGLLSGSSVFAEVQTETVQGSVTGQDFTGTVSQSEKYTTSIINGRTVEKLF